jgi:outer membrane lipoprotein-sorting protein
MVSFHSGMGRVVRCALILVWCASAASSAPAINADKSIIAAWLAAQTNINTWSADFTQTRTLKALTTPLTATGRFWFAAPDQFRWELGQPAETIAVRQTDQMLVIYPNLKRVERYPMAGIRSGPWPDLLALLNAGFPRTQSDLEKKFRITGHTGIGEIIEVTLQPQSAAARKMMPQLKIAFETNQFTLRSTELHFADGSRLRNDFTNGHINRRIVREQFNPVLDPGYEIVEPLKK